MLRGTNGVGGQSVEFDCLTGDICARAVVIIFLYDIYFVYLIQLSGKTPECWIRHTCRKGQVASQVLPFPNSLIK